MAERNLDFDTVHNRRGTDSLKYDFAAARGYKEDVLPLWVADMDFKTSSYIQDALQLQAEHGIYGYTETAKDYYESLMKDGDLFYGVTDGKDGTYANLCVTNSRRYGSSLKFFRSKDYNVRSGLVLPGLNIYSWPVGEGKDYLYNEAKNPTMPIGFPSKMTETKMENGEIQYVGDGKVDPDFTGCTTTDSETETNNLTRDDAVRQAEELLQKLTSEFV